MTPTFISRFLARYVTVMPVPQITCPNCGRTITLENRKQVDVDLIKQATQRGPTTFTELLRLTRLPRKTLSVRLKEMCQNGVIVKKEGTYMLNGNAGFDGNGGHLMKGVSRMLNDRRMRTGLMLVAFLLSSSVSGYVLATLFAAKEVHNEPTILGSFTAELGVADVNDLYAWSVLIVYDSSQLKIMSVTPGGFVGAEYPSGSLPDISKGIFINTTNIGEDKLLMAGSLIGKENPVRSGSGKLATIVFGYLTNDYTKPAISFTEIYETKLLDSNRVEIPIDRNTLAPLTFTFIEG